MAILDPVIKQFKNITEINQKMKIISDIYFISKNGNIYMKSLVPFIEKFSILHSDIKKNINNYMGYIYLPNEFFNFSKNAKKTKLIYTKNNDTLILGQDDSDKNNLTLNFYDEDFNDKDYFKFINKSFISRFYTKFDLLYKYSIDEDGYSELGESFVDAIFNNQCIYHTMDNFLITLTKHLFMDIKPNNKLFVKFISEGEDGFNNKCYVIYKLVNEFMTTFTITAYLIY